ncbi:MAG: hypothetical protein FJY99_06990 [Candidatus Sericytochromatia bacterium]|nr:hypothetical protein [Candidatus Tanganyikabacteria bacterium]
MLVAQYSAQLFAGGAFRVGVCCTLSFSTPSDLAVYLPSQGTAATLTQSWVNPALNRGGSLGGEVSALKLNVRVSDPGGLPPGFGNLIVNVETLDGAGVALRGKTVRQVLDEAESIPRSGPKASASVYATAAQRINSRYGLDNNGQVADPSLLACP